jgi:hypothetical protein
LICSPEHPISKELLAKLDHPDQVLSLTLSLKSVVWKPSKLGSGLNCIVEMAGQMAKKCEELAAKRGMAPVEANDTAIRSHLPVAKRSGYFHRQQRRQKKQDWA